MEAENDSMNEMRGAYPASRARRGATRAWIAFGIVAALLAVGLGVGWMIGRSDRRSGSSSSSDRDSERREKGEASGRSEGGGRSETFTLPGGVKMEMVYVEPGSFMMVMGEGNEKHRERVTKGFWLGKYEVTQAQWKAVMEENPSEFKGADLPVENVSWNDCQKFFEKLNALPEVKKSGWRYRLPTEKEWEYACWAGSTGVYCRLANGMEITENTLGEVAWYDYNSEGKTHSVGQKKPNAFGLYDMHGNVWEWCEDLYEAGSSDRVRRGGGWHDDFGSCWAGARGCTHCPDPRSNSLGFRLAASQE